MQTNLKNSIYLRDGHKDTVQEQAFNKTYKTDQVIMNQNPSLSINESTRKRAIKYHIFQKTLLKNFESHQAPLNFTRDTFNSKPLKPEIQQQQTIKIQRPCHNHFKNLMSQYNSNLDPSPPKEDPKVKQRRDQLSQKHHNRKAENIQNFKSNLLRRINFQTKEEIQSSIQQEMGDDICAKQAKIQNFIKRQQFYAQQKQVLREMRQFCIYGGIKIK